MNWELVFLGIMAVALVGMAAAQVILAREATKMVRRASDTLSEFRRELQPIIGKLHQATDDAGRAALIARQQAERIDLVMGSTLERIDETVKLIQDVVVRPIRQGSALLAGVRAAIAVFRAVSPPRSRPRSTRDEEDAMFIG